MGVGVVVVVAVVVVVVGLTDVVVVDELVVVWVGRNATYCTDDTATGWLVLVVTVACSALVSWSSAEVRFDCAWSSVFRAAVGSRVASSWPFTTWSPTAAYRCCRVPLVWKLASTSVPGSTLPVPETVDCTTPLAAVTTSREVRAELLGGPSSSTAASTTPAPRSPSSSRCQEERNVTPATVGDAAKSPT